MTEAAAGSLTGIGEIVLLPLDVLKIKRQWVDLTFCGTEIGVSTTSDRRGELIVVVSALFTSFLSNCNLQ
jgi:hypothetical protein